MKQVLEDFQKIFWLFRQQSDLLINHRDRLNFVLKNESTKTINSEYLSPLKEKINKATSFYREQTGLANKIDYNTLRIKEFIEFSNEISNEIDTNLSACDSNIKESFNFREVCIKDRVEAKALLKKSNDVLKSLDLLYIDYISKWPTAEDCHLDSSSL